MGPLDFDALFKRLKQGAPPDPVYYLYGDEDVLKDEAIRALLNVALDPAARDFNLDRRAAADLDPEALYALLNTPPLLADRRVVVLRGVEEARRKPKVRDELLRYLAAPSPTTVLVLVQSAAVDPDAELAARATAVDLSRLAPARVARWIAHRAKTLACALEPDAVDLLIAAVGNDLTALAAELEKLAVLGAERPVTAAEVAALVGVRRGETVYDLVDAALERRGAAAARLVEPVLEQAGMSAVRVVTALGTALIGTALARAELDGGVPRARLADVVYRHLSTARPYGLRNWREEARRWAAWAEGWSAAELRGALRRTLAADCALKGSTISDDRGILMELVCSFARAVEEAA